MNTDDFKFKYSSINIAELEIEFKGICKLGLFGTRKFNHLSSESKNNISLQAKIRLCCMPFCPEKIEIVTLSRNEISL